MASARKHKRQSLDGPSQDTPARSKKRKMSDLLGSPWTPAEVEAFFHGQQQHGTAWEHVAGLVQTRSAEECGALFTLFKTYLSLPEGAKSVQGLTAMMTDHFNSLQEDSEPESSTGGRERTPEPTPRRAPGGTPTRSPGQLPRPAKRARTVVPVGRRTPRPLPQPSGDLLRTPPRATRSLTADARSPPQSGESRQLRPRDLSRSPIRDRAQLLRGKAGGSPGKVAPRDGGSKHGGLKQIMKALEAVEEQENKKGRKADGAGGPAAPVRKPGALSKKAHILAKVQAQRSVSSGEEKAGSQAELEDNASSGRAGGTDGRSSDEERPPPQQERPTVGGTGRGRVESEPEEDVPIMKRRDLASPQAERRPLKKRKSEEWGRSRDGAAEPDSGSEATRSDDLPIIGGGRDSKAVTSKQATPQRKTPRKGPEAFQGAASGLDVLSSVVVAGDGLHSPPNASTSASPALLNPETQSTAKSRLPPATPPRAPASPAKLRPAATPPCPKPSPAKPKPKAKPKATPEKAPPPRAVSPEDSPADLPILPAKPKEKPSTAKAPPSPKPAGSSPPAGGSPAKAKGGKPGGAKDKAASGADAASRSEDAPLAPPQQRKRKRKPGVEKLPPVPPLPEMKEVEKKPRPRPRPRPPPSSPAQKSPAPAAQPAGSTDTQENTPLKARNKKKPARPASQRLGALTFASPPPPRPPAHCSHTDHSEGPAHSRKAHLLHCLNSRVRRWCLYEWFYSALDYPWFARNEFVEYLEHAGLGGVKRLTRTEWGVIRSSLGHPRRLSSVFLREEREKLAAYREAARAAYAEAGQGGDVPAELPAPLAVGQRVTAKHPRTRQIAEGAILTVDAKGRSRVQFDRRELASEIVQDIDMMPADPLKNMPATLRKKRLEMLMEARTRDHTPGELLVLRLEPLMAAADSQSAVALAKQATAEAMSAALAEPGTPPASPRTDAAAQATRDKDVKVLADLQRALDKKAALLAEMAHVTADAERRTAEAGSSEAAQAGTEDDALREGLAKKVLALEQVNKQVEQCVVRLRQRNRYADPASPAWVHANGGPGQPRGGQPATPREDLPPKPIGEMAASARRQARAMVAQVVAALQSAGEGEDPMLVLEALGPQLGLDDKFNRRLQPGARGGTSAAGPHAVPGILGTSRAAGRVNWAEAAAAAHSVADTGYGDAARSKAAAVPGDPLTGLEVGGHARSKEGGFLSELMASCVATLLMIQQCTDRALPQQDTVLTLDSAIASLKPHAQHNQRVWKEIESCINTIKGQILTQIPYQQLPASY